MGRHGCWLTGLLLLLQACASAPPQAPLEEAWNTYEQRARSRFETGDLAAAAYNFERSVAIAEMADDHRAMVTNLLNLGGTFALLDRFDDAESAFRRARQHASLHGQTRLEVRALSGMAELSYRRGDLVGASDRYRWLLERPELRRNPTAHGAVLNGLVLCKLAQGRLDDAEGYIESAESLFPSLTASGRSATLLNRATLELRRGSLDKAGEAAQAALAIDREQGYTPGIAADLELLGQTKRHSGDHQGARLYLAQALHLYQQLGQRNAIDRLQSLVESLSP